MREHQQLSFDARLATDADANTTTPAGVDDPRPSRQHRAMPGLETSATKEAPQEKSQIHPCDPARREACFNRRRKWFLA